MTTHVNCLTLKELKTYIETLEGQENVTEDTKIFLDTGWDSLQEVNPDALKTAQAVPYAIQDELTKEYFGGYQLLEKAQVPEGPSETIIIIENQY